MNYTMYEGTIYMVVFEFPYEFVKSMYYAYLNLNDDITMIILY